MNVIALGGCGAMGRATSWELAANHDVDLVIAGVDLAAADAFAAELPGDVGTVQVDVTDHDGRRTDSPPLGEPNHCR